MLFERWLCVGSCAVHTGSVWGSVHPLALHVSSIFLLRKPYYFPYFRLARFDSRPDFGSIFFRI